MALGLPNGIPFCWQPPVKTASDIESSPNLRISADGGVSEFSNGCLDGRAFSLVQASPVGVLPSLLIVPQSYKSGKLYAQLPNARVNHIPNNSMFGASGGVLPSGWTFSVGGASGVSLGYSASGQVTAEDGTLVDYIDFTFSGTATASGFLNLRPNASPSTISSVSGQSWNASVYFQLISGSVASISPTYQLQETTSGGTFINGNNITGLGSLTTSLPLRRYDVTRNLDTSGTVVTCRWGHSIASGTTYNYTLRIASPQLENLSSPTSVIRTVSGAVYAPYSGEAVRTNLALQSEDFTTTWTPTNITVSGNVTGTTDPAGGNTADQIFETAVSGVHFLVQTMAIVSGTTYAGSVFLKKAAGSPDWMQVAFSTTGLAGFANFNLTSGTVGLTGAGCTGSIENYGNGWYRCTLIQTATASGTSGGPVIVFTNNTNPITRYVNYTGNTSTSIYAWGAQLETGSSATPYIRTTTAPASFPVASIADFTVSRNTTATRVNSSGLIESVASGVPRIDWLGQSCPGLLVEASGQNLVPNGVGFNSATGVQTSSVTGSPAAAISGTLCTKNEASGTIRYVNQTFSASALASGTTYTVSRFFKYNGVDFTTTLEFNNSFQWGGVSWSQDIVLSLASGVTLGTSTSCTGSVENFGNGWYRVNVRITTGAVMGGGATVSVLSRLPASLSTGQGFLTACPQLEVGSVATTYIPTTSGAVSRAADSISASGALVSGLIGQTEGTIYAEFVTRVTAGTAAKRVLTISNGDDGNRISIGKAADDSLVGLILTGGVTQALISTAANQSGTFKMALAFQANDAVLYINGVQIGTDNSLTMPTGFNRIDLGQNAGNASQFNDHIRAAAIYTTRLSNAQLAELTRL